MDKEDLPSDDESDEDFRPDLCESDVPSEEDSDGEVEDIKTTSKRTTTTSQGNGAEKAVDNELESDEEEKERSAALYASFLSKTDNGNAGPSTKETNSNCSSAASSCSSERGDKRKQENGAGSSTEIKKAKVTQILKFAGEEIEVTKEVSPLLITDHSSKLEENQVKSHPKLPPKLKAGGIPRRSAGGLGSILSQIGKKNKISVLEKSKMDWNSFKETEGISEELQTHNKGKDGYLEKQDFLERTDHRQFEIEKSLRQMKRNNR